MIRPGLLQVVYNNKSPYADFSGYFLFVPAQVLMYIMP